MELQITIDSEGGQRTVRLEGECDLASAPVLREALRPMVPPEVSEVVIDASQLEFIDSTGLGVILGAHRRLTESGGVLKIAGAKGGVQRVLRVTGLDRAIPIV
jgi:anti-sigma B factor antagonist